MSDQQVSMFDAGAVRAQLDYPGCMDAMRDAMQALSQGKTRQLLRTMIDMGNRRVFAQMPAALGDDDYFGAKMVAVFPYPDDPGRRAHRGLVVLFEPYLGAPVCVADAEEITFIRTAAMSAVATDALARPDAKVMTFYGCGSQAETHLRAISHVRDLSEVRVWGRTPERAQAFAEKMGADMGISIVACADPRAAADGADIICTLTGSADPILMGEWVQPGTHVNLVGSSGPGSAEADQALVVNSRFIADSRPNITEQGGEFIRAREAGAITNDHIAAEIGEVLSGVAAGRETAEQITVFKSIGHAVQDLAAAAYLNKKASA